MKRLRIGARPGLNRVRTKGRRLARGRYRAVVTARDSAGNRSTKARRFVIR